MTDTAQRIAMAELDGRCTHGVDHWVYEGPEGDREIVCSICRKPPYNQGFPDYLSDLNAVHEVEKKIIREGKWYAYCDILFHVCGATDATCAYNATARQRCEAILKIKGRWQDSTDQRGGQA